MKNELRRRCDRLKHIIRERRMTYARVAEKMNRSPVTISRWANNRTALNDIDDLAGLSNLLNVSYAWLAGGIGAVEYEHKQGTQEDLLLRYYRSSPRCIQEAMLTMPRCIYEQMKNKYGT